MGKKLGSDIIHLNIMGQSIVVLNSAQAASDLLDKRSAIYSDRVNAAMVNDRALLDWSDFAGMLPYNDAWRRQRRRMTNWLNPRSVIQFNGLQQDEARLLLGRLLHLSGTPGLFEKVKHQFSFTTGSTMLRLIYGYRPKEDQDSIYVNALQASINLFQSTMISSQCRLLTLIHSKLLSRMERTDFLVNAFPILARVPDWVPGTGWKRTARKWREQKNEAVNAPYEWTKQQIAKGNFEHSILSSLLDEDESSSELSIADQEKELKQLCYTLFVGEDFAQHLRPECYKYVTYGQNQTGGTDTLATAFLSFVAAMVTNPETQKKAQNEIDSVIGYATRLPTLADSSQLPYIRQLTLEVMRWLPTAPTGGPPHACSQDDIYRGYNIQNGTMVAMSRDEVLYKDPERFDPERFADPDVVSPPGFGWGRRKCPGTHFAEASLFLVISSMLTTFALCCKVDKNGKEVTPKIEGDYNHLALTIKPFEFEIRPRSEEHRQLILDNIPKD
ncbi:cytochrome P450, partial [Rhizoctonia solani]